MEYSEQKANEIIRDFSLSEKTLLVWKSRNKIPDKYFNTQPPAKLTYADNQVIGEVTELLKNEKYNMTYISIVSGVKYSRLSELRKGKYTLKLDEAKAIKVQVNKVRITMKKIVELFQVKNRFSDVDMEILKQVCSHDLLVLQLVLANSKDRLKIKDWTLNKQSIDQKAVESIIESFVLLLLESPL